MAKENSENEEIPFLMNIGFLITYKCQIACPHCIVNAGPDRTEAMSLDDVCNWIDQIADYAHGKIKVVSFTGGEPFYDIDVFRKITEHTVSRGLVPTAVTNAFWATSEQEAFDILQSLPLLKFLSISTDKHHLHCIPLERIQNAVQACKRLDVVYGVTISTEDEHAEEHRELLDALSKIIDASRISTVTTFPVGRAEKSIDHSRYHKSRTIPATACSDAHTPVIFPDGNVHACIGPVITIGHDHPLLLGNLNRTPLAEILDEAEKNTILHIIRAWGPKYLLDMIDDLGYPVTTDREYINDSICDVCHTLMSDPKMVQAMREIADNKDVIEKTAYARKFYMNECEMLQVIGAEA